MAQNIQIYKFDDYKLYIKALIESSPNKGRGQFRKISDFLNVHSTLVSQVLSGNKDFSLEQALKITEYFKLNKTEKDYYLLLVQKEKSGSVDLKDYYSVKIEEIKNTFSKVASRVKAKKKLDENSLALYYSNWQYVAIWLSTSIDGFDTVENISSKFNIEPLKAMRIIDFLIDTGLCTNKDGKYKMGKTRTHLESTSPLVTRHHTNWRIKAMENFEKLDPQELAFTAPLTISKEDFKTLKSDILDFIELASKKVEKTNPEVVACLNIDLFKV